MSKLLIIFLQIFNMKSKSNAKIIEIISSFNYDIAEYDVNNFISIRKIMQIQYFITISHLKIRHLC